MHVEAMTRFIPREVLARIANPQLVETAAPQMLRCELERQPPKVFLSEDGVPFPPAAELRIDPLAEGSHVTLRLMWGPLPAPFPRGALWRQRAGERRLQDYLSSLLGGCTFSPRAH